MIYVIKRDGRKVPFSTETIKNAILKAFLAVDGKLNDYAEAKAENIANYIEGYCEDIEEPQSIEEIQDLVENGLMSTKRKDVAKAYIKYREERTKERGNLIDSSVLELLEGNNEYWNTENSNKDATVVTVQRDYLAGILSTDISKRKLLPKDVCEAHEAGIIHQHDMDYMAQKALNNCGLINLEDMLMNGTIINGIRIDPQHKLLTATTVATQIITAVASSQYGGCTITLAHLAPFVKMSQDTYEAKYSTYNIPLELQKQLIEQDLQKEIEASVQTFNYQINSMSTTNGQAPFLSVCMWIDENPQYEKENAMLIEEFLKQRIKGMKNEKGIYITPAFPKLLYILDENNINENSQYWYLTELAAKCTAKRLVPDYISAKKMREYKINKFGISDVYPCMGCRSFLTPDRIEGNPAKALNYDPNKGKYYGRFNMGVTTINLFDLALSSEKNKNKFWKLFEERTELCHKGLLARIKRLNEITSDVAPVLWQNGAYARLDKGEKLTNLIYGGYATASLGYAGLYECVKYMTGSSHTDGSIGEKFGLEVMQALNALGSPNPPANRTDPGSFGASFPGSVPGGCCGDCSGVSPGCFSGTSCGCSSSALGGCGGMG